MYYFSGLCCLVKWVLPLSVEIMNLKDMKVQAKRIFLLVTAMNHRFVSETGKYEFGVRHKNPI